MERVIGVIFGVVLLAVALSMIPDNYNRLRGHVGAKPLPPPNISISYEPPMVPVKISVGADLLLDVSFDMPLNSGDALYGFSISPEKVRQLKIILGQEAREYDVRGVVRVAIPNTLSGRNSLEWAGDTAIIRIPDPQGIHFSPLMDQ